MNLELILQNEVSQKEKNKYCILTPEDEVSGWHHWLDGLESEWTLGVCDGQGGLACCDSWGGKESDTTEWLNWTELNAYIQNQEEWYRIIYLQGSSGETDIENRLMDMGRGEERVRCMERVTWALTLPYVKYITKGNLLYGSGNQTGALYQPRVGWCGIWEGGSKGRGYMYTMTDSCWGLTGNNKILWSNYPSMKNKLIFKKEPEGNISSCSSWLSLLTRLWVILIFFFIVSLIC